MKAFKSFFKDIDTSIEYDPAELEKGIKTELEHTNYKAIATIIAKHHLAEDPHYYTKLTEVESEAKSEDNEERRLDKSCWTGYHKKGTKVIDGVRVNNCVKSEDSEDIHKAVNPGILSNQVSGKLTCTKARSLKSKQKNKGNNTAKAAQRYLNYHC
jgi:hypothetical protein